MGGGRPGRLGRAAKAAARSARGRICRLSGPAFTPPPAAREHLPGTSICHLPLGTRTGKFPFSVWGGRKKSDRAPARISALRSFCQTPGRRGREGRLRARLAGLPPTARALGPDAGWRPRVPARYRGAGRGAPLSGCGRSRQGALRVQRGPQHVFPTGRTFSELTDPNLRG